jgi:membrane protease YdiL (CAAX protease family)
MRHLTLQVQRHPLIAFFVLAYLFSWTLIPLVSISLVFAPLGLFGPALAAVTVTAMTEGRTGVKALLAKLGRWRVGWQWYGVVLALPTLVALTVLGAHLLLGGTVTFRVAEAAVIGLVLGILVVGEEIGWRGYALPRLQARFGGLGASLVLGVLWAAWHLANVLIPGLEYYGYAFPAFLLYVVSLSVLFTWIANGTRGSVLIAWLFHAAINLSGAIFAIGNQERALWLGGIAFGIAALGVVLVTSTDLSRKPVLTARGSAPLIASTEID